jgi:hypothetical protein
MLLWIAAFRAGAQDTKTAPDTGKILPELYLGLQLSSDSIIDENIVIKFKKDALMDYEVDEDGRYSSRYEDLHMCSVSSDGIPLVTNVIPFPGLTPEMVRLYVCPKAGGQYKFRFTAIFEIPKHLKIKLIDKYTNRAVGITQGKCYSFNIDKNAFLSYGDRRFMLVIYQDQNYSFRPEVFGIDGRKKKVTAMSAPARVYSAIKSQ